MLLLFYFNFIIFLFKFSMDGSCMLSDSCIAIETR